MKYSKEELELDEIVKFNWKDGDPCPKLTCYNLDNIKWVVKNFPAPEIYSFTDDEGNDYFFTLETFKQTGWEFEEIPKRKEPKRKEPKTFFEIIKEYLISFKDHLFS